jgi:hypothetical protein
MKNSSMLVRTIMMIIIRRLVAFKVPTKPSCF